MSRPKIACRWAGGSFYYLLQKEVVTWSNTNRKNDVFTEASAVTVKSNLHSYFLLFYIAVSKRWDETSESTDNEASVWPSAGNYLQINITSWSKGFMSTIGMWPGRWMGSYYAICSGLTKWFVCQGISRSDSRWSPSGQIFFFFTAFWASLGKSSPRNWYTVH